MGRVRFRGRDWVRTTFWDRNVDPGTCLTWQNHDVGKAMTDQKRAIYT